MICIGIVARGVMAAGAGGGDQERRSTRHPLPSGMAHVTVHLEIHTLKLAQPMVGRLWDVSAHGACVAIPGCHQLVLPAGGRLQIVEPLSQRRHLVQVDLRWGIPLSHTTFIGLLFDASLRPRETFLADFMRATWSDAVPRSRFNV